MPRPEYVFSDKYEPLFALLNDDRETIERLGLQGVRVIVVQGGRGSGKSHAVATGICCSTYADGYNVLFTRYTMVAAEVSIVPEFAEKIDILGRGGDFEVKRADIVNNVTGGQVLFRGLMQSSKNQVARLKSIHNVKVWVLDEAQELTSKNLYDTIDLSVRTTGARNLIIVVFNPTDVDHWLYAEFYERRGVDEDFCGVRGDVLYIHTDYLDNVANLSESFLARAERMKAEDPERFDNIFLGHFLKRRQGLIFPGWQEIPADQYPDGLPQWYGNDWGYSDDPDALVRMCYEPVTGTLYVREVAYERGMLPRDVARAVLDDAQTIGYAPEDCLVYCDPARPESRDELRVLYGIDARSAVNRDKPGRIAYLRGFRVKYVGEHIGKEVKTYGYKPSPRDEDRFTDEPRDGNDHAMDAINYGAVTHLRPQGVAGGGEI